MSSAIAASGGRRDGSVTWMHDCPEPAEAGRQGDRRFTSPGPSGRTLLSSFTQGIGLQPWAPFCRPVGPEGPNSEPIGMMWHEWICRQDCPRTKPGFSWPSRRSKPERLPWARLRELRVSPRGPSWSCWDSTAFRCSTIRWRNCGPRSALEVISASCPPSSIQFRVVALEFSPSARFWARQKFF